MKGRKGKTFLAQDAAERLYRLNRGGLRQYGIRLPVELVFEAGEAPMEHIAKALDRRLYAAGFDTGKGANATRRFQLRIRMNGAHAVCELYDVSWGSAVFRHTLPLASFSASDITTFARALGDMAFTER
jgi:hypothetical protein